MIAFAEPNLVQKYILIFTSLSCQVDQSREQQYFPFPSPQPSSQIDQSETNKLKSQKKVKTKV